MSCELRSLMSVRIIREVVVGSQQLASSLGTTLTESLLIYSIMVNTHSQSHQGNGGMENMNRREDGVRAEMRASIAPVDPELDPSMSPEVMWEKLQTLHCQN